MNLPDKKIKVLYIIDFGGMAHYTAMLANAVSQRTDLIVLGQIGMNLDYISHNIRMKNILKYPIGWDIRNLLLFKNLLLIDTVKPDIIHVTTPYPIINAAISIFFAQRYPVIVTVHDPRPHSGEVENNWRNAFIDYTQNLIIKEADKLIVHSEGLKSELLERRIPTKRVAVIPHGDYSFFTKYRKNVPPEKNSILFFGRIVKYKGLDYLIRAVPIISKEIPDIKVIIAGEGGFKEYRKLINNSNNHFEKHFEVHNEFIQNEDVAELFERTQLLVLPYTEATQSGPLHIACAFKKPVVATNVGALPEVIEHGETGLIIPPKDVNALAQAIIKLLKDDELRKKMGERSYIKMKEDMSWDNIAEKTIKVYKEAIALHYSVQK